VTDWVVTEWVISGWSGARHPLSPVIKLGFQNPRKKEKKTEGKQTNKDSNKLDNQILIEPLAARPIPWNGRGRRLVIRTISPLPRSRGENFFAKCLLVQRLGVSGGSSDVTVTGGLVGNSGDPAWHNKVSTKKLPTVHTAHRTRQQESSSGNIYHRGKSQWGRTRHSVRVKEQGEPESQEMICHERATAWLFHVGASQNYFVTISRRIGDWLWTNHEFDWFEKQT